MEEKINTIIVFFIVLALILYGILNIVNSYKIKMKNEALRKRELDRHNEFMKKYKY